MRMAGGRRKGFTMVELLVVIAIIALLAAFLLPVIAAATASARRANCSNKERQIYQGLRMYLNNFEEFLPLAFLKTVGDNTYLQKTTYWRFLIHEFAEAGFNHMVDTDPNTKEKIPQKAQRDKLFWSDPARGYTLDYMAPSLLFTGHLDINKEIDTSKNGEFDKHVHFGQAIQDVAATQRPLLTESDAGYPAVADPSQDPEDWKEKPAANEHKTELQEGWTLAELDTNVKVLIGVGRSLRTVGDYGKVSSRIDFRHNKAANVLFLDGHVDMVSETNQVRIGAIHNAWNNMAPTGQ